VINIANAAEEDEIRQEVERSSSSPSSMHSKQARSVRSKDDLRKISLQRKLSTSSDKITVLSGKLPCMEHTFVCEAGGSNFVQLTSALKEDAKRSVDAVDVAIDSITATVAHFDRQCVHSSSSSSSEGSGSVSSLSQFVELLSIFEGQRASFSPKRFIIRILKYSDASPCNVVIALIYLHRIQRSTCPAIHLSKTNMQRLLLTSLMVASKVFDDIYYSNRHWGSIGEISTQEINMLERR
jgi:hypothetical protein